MILEIVNIILIIAVSGLANGFYYAGNKDGAVMSTVLQILLLVALMIYSASSMVLLIMGAISWLATIALMTRVFTSDKPDQIKNKNIHVLEHIIKLPLYTYLLIAGGALTALPLVVYGANFLFNIPIQVGVGNHWISDNDGKKVEDIWVLGFNIFNKKRINSGYGRLALTSLSLILFIIAKLVDFDINIYELWELVKPFFQYVWQLFF